MEIHKILSNLKKYNISTVVETGELTYIQTHKMISPGSQKFFSTCIRIRFGITRKNKRWRHSKRYLHCWCNNPTRHFKQRSNQSLSSPSDNESIWSAESDCRYSYWWSHSGCIDEKNSGHLICKQWSSIVGRYCIGSVRKSLVYKRYGFQNSCSDYRSSI